MNHAIGRVLTAAALFLGAASAQAQGSSGDRSAEQNPRWAPIHRVFGQGEAEDGYFRVNLPRSDLHVRIGKDALSPGFEFTSYVGFVPMGTDNVMAISEVIVLQSEVPAVLGEIRRQGLRVTALHNHLMNEEPRIMYVHVMGEGAPAAVAARFRSVFARTATPLAPSAEEKNSVDWSGIDAVLGKHSEAHGTVAEYAFPRREQLRMHGMSVKSSEVIETASEVVFQQLGDGRVASTGELYLLASEVESVVQALDERGLHVTALHTHMLDDGPPHYWVHWYTTGDGPVLARGIKAVLAHMNSARATSANVTPVPINAVVFRATTPIPAATSYSGNRHQLSLRVPPSPAPPACCAARR
jgi:uncharacterized protein DUF1259